MKRGTRSILAAALVAAFCHGTAALVAARETGTYSANPGEVGVAQIFDRDRPTGRERRIQQFRDTPPRRDNDRFLRERREEAPADPSRFRRDRPNSEQDRATDAVRRGDVLPLGGIIRSVEQFCPGTFLDATLHERGRGFAYNVTILRPNGRRVTLLVDAQSGSVLRGRCN